MKAASALTGGALVLCLLWTTFFAASSIHQQSHATKSTRETHTCAVCLFAHGHVLSANVAAQRLGHIGEVVHFALPDFPSPTKDFDNRLPDGRAPPTVHL